MKAILLLCIIVGALAISSNKSELRRQFNDFKHKYGKTYATADEESYRFQVFQDTLVRAEEQQKLNPNAKFGVNGLADLTHEEFSSRYLMNPETFKEKWAIAKSKMVEKDFTKPQQPNLRGCQANPTTYDWNADCGVVTGVYNQGQCGSCWAFSATETIESYYALAGNTLTSLSVSQIVDCDTTDGGCNGGEPTTAYQYVESAGGLDSWNTYPYTAEGGESGSCNFNSGAVVAQVTGYNSITGETGLYQQASTGGPVSVCVDASAWQSYQGGVLSNCACGGIDHCVQLTGYSNYGESGATWLVRNSWATSWGENGYILLPIGSDCSCIGEAGSIVSAS